jgi:hypothetical protein
MHVRDIRIIRTDLRTDIDQVRKTLSPLFRRHLFFLPRREVTALLETNMPEVDSIEVDKRYPATLAVRITLDPLIAELRVVDADGNTANSLPGGQTGSPLRSSGAGIVPSQDVEVEQVGTAMHGYLNDKGMYLEYSEVQVGTLLHSSGATTTTLPTINIVDWGVRPQPRTMLISMTMITNMQRAEQAILDQFGQPVRARTIYLRAREFHLQTPDHSLWFDMASPLEEQLDRYKLFLQAAGKDAAKEYVDLRLKDRIVYK